MASTNAAAGLVVDDEQPPIHVTDDLQQMADSIVDELEAADRDPAPIESNRTWVADRFDWDVSARRIDAILQGFTTHSTDDGKS